MIPKKIHYCWFGKTELPANIREYINSWKKYLCEYEFIQWNETNFDININPYVKEAYEAKKWAFVSDYVRLYVLYNEGGIYLDSDIEVLRNFDNLLENYAFGGFESKGVIATCILGTEKKNPIFKNFIDYYVDRHFKKENGVYDMTPNTVPISKICREYGMIEKNIRQKLNYITIYPEDYFCPKSIIDGKIRLTENSYTIHHFDGSWQSEKSKFIKWLKYKIFSIIGNKYYPMIRKYYRYIKNK